MLQEQLFLEQLLLEHNFGPKSHKSGPLVHSAGEEPYASAEEEPLHLLLPRNKKKCKVFLCFALQDDIQFKVSLSSSSSFGCGAGDYKLSPGTSIFGKSGYLFCYHLVFIIPLQSIWGQTHTQIITKARLDKFFNKFVIFLQIQNFQFNVTV